jgi:hypothetical protein
MNSLSLGILSLGSMPGYKKNATDYTDFLLSFLICEIRLIRGVFVTSLRFLYSPIKKT